MFAFLSLLFLFTVSNVHAQVNPTTIECYACNPIVLQQTASSTEHFDGIIIKNLRKTTKIYHPIQMQVFSTYVFISDLRGNSENIRYASTGMSPIEVINLIRNCRCSTNVETVSQLIQDSIFASQNIYKEGLNKSGKNVGLGGTITQTVILKDSISIDSIQSIDDPYFSGNGTNWNLQGSDAFFRNDSLIIPPDGYAYFPQQFNAEDGYIYYIEVDSTYLDGSRDLYFYSEAYPSTEQIIDGVTYYSFDVNDNPVNVYFEIENYEQEDIGFDFIKIKGIRYSDALIIKDETQDEELFTINKLGYIGLPKSEIEPLIKREGGIYYDQNKKSINYSDGNSWKGLNTEASEGLTKSSDTIKLGGNIGNVGKIGREQDGSMLYFEILNDSLGTTELDKPITISRDKNYANREILSSPGEPQRGLLYLRERYAFGVNQDYIDRTDRIYSLLQLNYFGSNSSTSRSRYGRRAGIFNAQLFRDSLEHGYGQYVTFSAGSSKPKRFQNMYGYKVASDRRSGNSIYPFTDNFAAFYFTNDITGYSAKSNTNPTGHYGLFIAGSRGAGPATSINFRNYLDGSTGIGEENPTAKLHVKNIGPGTTETVFRVQGDDDIDLFAIENNGAVGIGTLDPDPSALLDLSSQVRGVLIPRMTTVDKEAILNPAQGLMVYDSTLKRHQEFNGSEWKSFGDYISASEGLLRINNDMQLGGDLNSATSMNVNGNASLSLRKTITSNASTLIANFPLLIDAMTNIGTGSGGSMSSIFSLGFTGTDDELISSGTVGALGRVGLGPALFTMNGVGTRKEVGNGLHVQLNRVYYDAGNFYSNGVKKPIVTGFSASLNHTSSQSTDTLQSLNGSAIKMWRSTFASPGRINRMHGYTIGFNNSRKASEGNIGFAVYHHTFDGVTGGRSNNTTIDDQLENDGDFAFYDQTGWDNYFKGRLGLNQPQVDPSAIFEANSTTQGILPPRMTESQRNAISNPATALTLFCTDCTATDTSTGVTQTWNGSTWKNHW